MVSVEISLCHTQVTLCSIKLWFPGICLALRDSILQVAFDSMLRVEGECVSGRIRKQRNLSGTSHAA